MRTKISSGKGLGCTLGRLLNTFHHNQQIDITVRIRSTVNGEFDFYPPGAALRAFSSAAVSSSSFTRAGTWSMVK
jgi:hypothetical protein